MTYQLFPIAPPGRIHADSEFNQLNANSARLADGGAIVVWTDARGASGSDGSDIKAQRYDSDGAPAGPEQLIYAGAPDTTWRPFVTGLEEGGHAIAWQPHADDSSSARIAVFDENGTRVATVAAPVPGPSGALSVNASGTSHAWALTALDGGGFALTWAANAFLANPPRTQEAWFTQVFDGDGTASGGPLRITDWTWVGSDREFVVDGTSLGDGYALLLSVPPAVTGLDRPKSAIRLFDESGAPTTGYILLDQGTTGLQTAGKIATLADGTLVASWYASGSFDDGWEGYGSKLRRLDSDGTPLDDGQLIEGGTTLVAQVVAMEDGGFLAISMVPRPAGGGYPREMRAQRYDAEGNPVDDFFTVANLSTDTDGNAYHLNTFYGQPHFIPLQGGPLIGIFEGTVTEYGHEIAIRPFMPDIVGSGGDDVLHGHAIGTALYGLDGDDRLIGGPGDDMLDGGEGTDTALYQGALSDYALRMGEDGTVIATDLRNAEDTGDHDGTDRLVNIDLVAFADETAPLADIILRDITVAPQDGAGAAMHGVTASFTPEGGAAMDMAPGADGSVAFSLMAREAGTLQIGRAYDPVADRDITAGDALDVLRIAVGLNPSWGPAAAENFIAADIDQSGVVTAQDALEVLRAAVGLAPENAPRWVFVDSDDDLAGVTGAGNVAYETGIDIAAHSGDLDLAMTGILLGNMEAV